MHADDGVEGQSVAMRIAVAAGMCGGGVAYLWSLMRRG